MTAVRNACVARGTIAAAGGAVVYTVPANTVFLIKSVVLTLQPAGPTSYLIILKPGDGSVTVFLAEGSLAQSATSLWQGWAAMNAGDVVQINSSVGGLAYWVSGAVLPYVPGQ